LGQVKLATRRVAQYHEEQWKRKKARKEVSKEIAEIIKKHSKCYDVD
jgi:predicted nucleotidyltransferase